VPMAWRYGMQSQSGEPAGAVKLACAACRAAVMSACKAAKSPKPKKKMRLARSSTFRMWFLLDRYTTNFFLPCQECCDRMHHVSR